MIFFDNTLTKLAELYHEFPYCNNKKNILVDLHWHIFRQGFSFSPSAEIIWEQLDQIKLNNQEIETLTLEILIIFLCIHSAKHGWTELSLICELAYLLSKNPQINWQKIEYYFGKFGTKRMVLISLNLTKIFYNIPLTEAIAVLNES